MTHGEWIDLARLVLEALGAISTLLLGLFGWMHWSLRKEMVTKSELATYRAAHDKAHKDLDARLAEGENRFNEIKADIEHLPNHKDLEALGGRLGKIEGSIEKLTAMIGGLKDVLARVEKPLDVLVANHLRTGS